MQPPKKAAQLKGFETMSFRMRKSYFKIGNVKKEERKEMEAWRVKSVVWFTKIDLEEELAKGIMLR